MQKEGRKGNAQILIEVQQTDEQKNDRTNRPEQK